MSLFSSFFFTAGYSVLYSMTDLAPITAEASCLGAIVS